MSAANPTDQSSDQTPLLQADDQAGYGSELTTAPADGNGPASPPIRKVEVAFGPLACLVAQHCSKSVEAIVKDDTDTDAVPSAIRSMASLYTYSVSEE